MTEKILHCNRPHYKNYFQMYCKTEMEYMKPEFSERIKQL